MTLTFEAALPTRGFDIGLAVETGETVAVLGPNGAGKSTLLALIAGLLAPAHGRAELDREVLFDTASAARRWLPPHRRQIALLAQDALLFPHLSVLDNVAFGPSSRGIPRREARARARHWLAELDAAEFGRRRPQQLSGGQAQRVAVARAMAAEPRLLLLDEPLAALDVAVAPGIRRMLRRALDGRTAVVVTHDILDAYTLADRVVVIEGGRIVEQGPVRKVLEWPTQRFTAEIAGLNILSGARTATGLRTADGVQVDARLSDTAGGGRASGAERGATGAAGAIAAVRPSNVRVDRLRPDRHANVFPAEVTDLEPRGDLVRVRSALLSADISPARAADLDLAAGSIVWFSFDAVDAMVYPAGPHA